MDDIRCECRQSGAAAEALQRTGDCQMPRTLHFVSRAVLHCVEIGTGQCCDRVRAATEKCKHSGSHLRALLNFLIAIRGEKKLHMTQGR